MARVPFRLAATWSGRAEPLGRRRLVDLHVARIEAEDVADHEADAARLDRLDDPPRMRGVMGERLLEEDRLPRLGRGDCRVGHARGRAGRC